MRDRTPHRQLIRIYCRFGLKSLHEKARFRKVRFPIAVSGDRHYPWKDYLFGGGRRSSRGIAPGVSLRLLLAR